MLCSSDVCLKCSPPTDHVSRVSQAGRPFVRGLPAQTRFVFLTHFIFPGMLIHAYSICVHSGVYCIIFHAFAMFTEILQMKDKFMIIDRS